MKTNFFRSLLNKAVLTGSLLASSFYAAQNASAQESFDDFYKKKTEQKDKKVSVADDNKTVSKKLDDILNGSLQIKAETEPLVDRASATFQAELKLGNFRPYFGIQDEYQRFKNIDDSRINVNSVREILGLGFYAKNDAELEVYLRGILGREDDKFSGDIKMDASRWIFGGEFGLASKEHGFRGLLKVYGGKGEFDAELESGYEIDGDYDTLFAGIDVVQRLYTENDAFAKLEKAGMDRWRNDIPSGLVDLVAQAYWNRNKFGELETDSTYSLKIGPRFSFDLRDENHKGGILSITPYVMGKITDTESDISLRETRTKTLGVGIQPRWDITPNLSVGGDFAFQYNGQKIDDPGQGLHEDKTKNGVKAGLYIELKF